MSTLNKTLENDLLNIKTIGEANDHFYNTFHVGTRFRIKFFNAKGNFVGYLKDDAKDKFFDNKGTFTDNDWPLTTKIEEAMILTCQDETGLICMKDENFQGCELFHEFEFGSYLIEIVE